MVSVLLSENHELIHVLTCVATDISMEKPKKVPFCGIDRALTWSALFGTAIVNAVAGAGSGIGGGSMKMGLYAASPVYWGGPCVVTKEVVAGILVVPTVPVAAALDVSTVVEPRGP